MLTLELRAATLAPSTFDEKANTVEVVVSTGADVRRSGYIERLPVANADLRSIVGKPVLDSHSQASTRAVLGVVEKAWVANGELRALIKLSSRDDVAGTVRDIREGIIRSLSVGYQVTRWADSTTSKGERVRTALAWIPHEVSFVAIPADPGAVTRSLDMDPDIETPDAPAPTEAEQRAQTRAEIRTIMKRAGATPDQADALIDSDATVEQARAAAYELMTARTADAPRVRIIASHDDPAVQLERRMEGLACRIGGGKPSDAAREFVGFSLVEHAREMLTAAGISTRGLTAEQVLTRAMSHGLSDFAELLTGTGARLLKPAYEAALSPLVALCRKATASDFRTQTMLQLGEMPKLLPLGEHGEVQAVTRGEAKDSWALDTYAAMFGLSRKALINDDLNAFADFASAAGEAAAETVADLLVSTLTQSGGAGPVMGDTVRMFHVDHGNVVSASMDVWGVSDIRKAMLTQTGIDGETIIRVRPDTIVVSPTLLTRAEQLVAQITPANSEDVNPFAGKLTVVCEPRLELVEPYRWYLVDSRLPALVLGGLSGNEGPQIASRDGFEVLGREFRVTLDVGVGPNDWRGWTSSLHPESSNSQD